VRRLPVVPAVPALAVVLLALLVALPAVARAASGQDAGGPVKQPVATGTGGAVASMDVDASQAGIDVLKHGGNAVDAAVATASALGVTIPFVAGPGGGGFMVIYLAKSHQVVTINGRETCPAACTATMFTDPKTGQPLDYNQASDQPLATGVPSMVATWAKAVGLYGRQSLAADLQPAIGVAERGFRVNADFVQLTQWDLPVLRAYPASRALLLTPSGDLEASRLSYADRNAYVGDPRYVSVPLSGLLDPAFAATRRCLIRDQALVSPVAPGHPYPPYGGCVGQSAPQPAAEGGHTNNIVTVDKWGNIVAFTNTINFFGGSGQTVPGYGFLLNNEMTDFDFAPPAAGASDPNLPAGGKQPRSSMGPVIAFAGGHPVFSVGAAGGSTIPTTILQIIVNHVDFGMSLPAALAAPRVSQRNAPTSLAEPGFYNSALAAQLTSQYGEKFTLATGPILPLENYRATRPRCRSSATGRLRRSPSRSGWAAGAPWP
jgi:gamma-glutamyltranspeptidase